CLALVSECDVATFCHVTGGGLAGNLERVLPGGLVAEVNRASWTPAEIFRTIASFGKVSLEEMEKTFNMGVGMIAIVSPEDRDRGSCHVRDRVPGAPRPHLGDVNTAPA